MKRTVSILAGAAALALANVAVAEEAQVAAADEPVLLTDAQMDGVTAGQFADGQVLAFASGDVIVDGDFFIDTLPGVFAFASISADIIPFNDAFVFLSASANVGL